MTSVIREALTDGAVRRMLEKLERQLLPGFGPRSCLVCGVATWTPSGGWCASDRRPRSVRYSGPRLPRFVPSTPPNEPVTKRCVDFSGIGRRSGAARDSRMPR
jgi:hypothetical protein